MVRHEIEAMGAVASSIRLHLITGDALDPLLHPYHRVGVHHFLKYVRDHSIAGLWKKSMGQLELCLPRYPNGPVCSWSGVLSPLRCGFERLARFSNNEAAH